METKRRTKREGNEHTAVAAIPGGLARAVALPLNLLPNRYVIVRCNGGIMGFLYDL